MDSQWAPQKRSSCSCCAVEGPTSVRRASIGHRHRSPIEKLRLLPVFGAKFHAGELHLSETRWFSSQSMEPVVPTTAPGSCHLFVKTMNAGKKNERTKSNSTRLPNGAYSIPNTRTSPSTYTEEAPIAVPGIYATSQLKPTPKLERGYDKQPHRFSPNRLGIWDVDAATSLADVIGALDPDCDRSSRAQIVGEMWHKEKQYRMRQTALARRPIIREIEDRLWAEKTLPSQLQEGADDEGPDNSVMGAIHQDASAIVPDEETVGGADDYKSALSRESVPQFAVDVALVVTGMESLDIEQQVGPKTKVVSAVKKQSPGAITGAPAFHSRMPSRYIQQKAVGRETPGSNVTPVKPEVSASPHDSVETPTRGKHNLGAPFPHLRKPLPIRANPVYKRNFLETGLTASSRESITYKKTGKQSGVTASPPVNTAKSTQNPFKIPANPHVGGYNIAAVLPDPRTKIDVKGLKFSAWPQPVNRGDKPIQELRTVVIAGFPTAPTLSTISSICGRTGKLEKILIDESRKKAQVTFMDAEVAHNFYTGAQKGLEVFMNDQTGNLTVVMDYPIDILPYAMQERSPTRMVLFSNWDKQEVMHVTGRNQSDHDLEQMLTRLAYQYVPGGRIEAVTVKEQGWEYFDGTILFAGIVEAMAAYDGLKVEAQFKGCIVAFGKDP